MKTKLKYICLSAAAGLTLSLSSCSDFMDLTPEDQYDETTVWSDADLAKTVVNDVYSYVCDIAQEVNPDAWTDDAFFTHVYGCRDINEATVSPSNLGAYDRDDCPFKWSKQYKGIYRANLVLANIDNVPEKTGVDLNILKGETYFLRAYIYTELLRGFGGVPIVDKVYSIEEASALNLPRANVADVMDFILKDIEQATNLLPEQQTGVNLGRATKGAAKALKARLLLHVASPLFADRTVNKLECNQYTGDRQALYQQALDAAKDVINDSNYSLIDCNAGTIKEIAEKFHNIIITNNEETIWSKQYVNKDLNADNWVRNRVACPHCRADFFRRQAAAERVRIGAVFVLLHQLERAVHLMQCAGTQVARFMQHGGAHLAHSMQTGKIKPNRICSMISHCRSSCRKPIKWYDIHIMNPTIAIKF